MDSFQQSQSGTAQTGSSAQSAWTGGAKVETQTQAALAKERLLAEEYDRKLGLILEEMTDGLMAVARDWRLTHVNPAAARLLHENRENLLGRSIWEAMPQAGRSPCREHLHRVMDKRECVTFEEYHSASKGWFEYRCLPASEGVIVFFRDVTERVRAAEESQRMERQLGAVLQNTNTGIYLLTPDLRIIHINRRWEDLMHVRNKDVQGKSIYELVPRDIAEGCHADVKRVLASRAPVTTESIVNLPSGPIHYSVTKTPLFDAATGEIWGVVGVSTDISQQKAMEKSLRDAMEKLGRANEELEQRVRERTATLEGGLKALEGVLYHVAHDLRAPLRSMHSFTQLLMESCGTKLDPSSEVYAKIILDASMKVDVLIHDLLNYGRLGYQNVELTPVDPNPLVDRVTASFMNDPKNSRARIQVDQPLPEVLADVEVLEQVLINLISNALKFVAPGVAPRVHIWAETYKGMVRLNIADNGIGIAPEYQERIFRVFERLHGGEDPYPGTGIGLAIVKKGMERLQGRVGVESRPGAGSRFWLELKKAPNE